MTINIGIYIYERAEVLDFSGPFEVFTTATRVAGREADKHGEPVFNTWLISQHGGLVTARAGYQVMSDFSMEEHPHLDVLLISGGDHTDEMHKRPVQQWLAGAAAKAGVVASVCTGAFLLAAAGILKNQNVTTHWEDKADLQRQFPNLQVDPDPETRWVVAGNIVTSAGITAGIDMSLYLVSRLISPSLARATATQMEFSSPALDLMP